MTIICALHDAASNEVWLGSNSQHTLGDIVSPGPSDPWMQFGDWVIALSGEAVHTDILEIEAERFPAHESHPTHFIRFLKQTYQDYEIGRKEDNWASNSYEVWGLIVHRDGRIWDIDSHLALSTIPSGHLWARGSGMEYALGADYALNDQNADARIRVEQAVAAAIHYDINCPGSVQIKKFPVSSNA